MAGLEHSILKVMWRLRVNLGQSIRSFLSKINDRYADYRRRLNRGKFFVSLTACKQPVAVPYLKLVDVDSSCSMVGECLAAYDFEACFFERVVI